MRRGRSALALTLALGAAGCALILGIEDKPVSQAPDASPPGETCPQVLPPPAPDHDDDRSALTPMFTLAASAFEVGRPDGGVVGFDLDKTCTCSPEAGAPSCTSPFPACDDDGGIDNGFATLPDRSLLSGVGGFRTDDVACGRSTVLFVIRGYNGLANDQQLEVSAISSPGLDQPHDADDKPAECRGAVVGPPVYRPRWDGTDKWSSDARLVKVGTRAPLQHLAGYVRDWVLVAQATPDQVLLLPLPLASAPVVVEATQVTLVAQLEPLDESGKALAPGEGTRAAKVRFATAQLAARVAVSAALRAMTSVSLTGGVGYVCPGSGLFEAAKKELCDHVDVAADPRKDFRGVACDAISSALRFVAEPAVMTDARDVDAGKSACPEAITTCP